MYTLLAVAATDTISHKLLLIKVVDIHTSVQNCAVVYQNLKKCNV